MNLRAVCTVALGLITAQTASTNLRAEETILVGMCREAHVAEAEVETCAAKADDCLEEAMRTAHREDPSRNPNENGDYEVLTQATLLACVAKGGGRIDIPARSATTTGSQPSVPASPPAEAERAAKNTAPPLSGGNPPAEPSSQATTRTLNTAAAPALGEPAAPAAQSADVEAVPPLDPSKVPRPPRRPRRSEVAAVTPRVPAAPRTRPATTTPNILDNTSEDATPDPAGAAIVIPSQDGDVTASAGGAEPEVPAALPKPEGQESHPVPSPLPQVAAPSGSRLVPPDMPLANPPQAPAGPAPAPATQQQAASEGTVVADQPRLKTGGRWTGCTSFKTYNPKTQTYRGKDGLMHECKEN